MVTIAGRALVPGHASGPLLVLGEPLSFWGGVEPTTGAIRDAHHPQFGTTVTGTVMRMVRGRGSSSASSVLAEMIRTGLAPAAIVLEEPDPIVVLGSIVAQELYGLVMPVLVVPGDVWSEIDVARHPPSAEIHAETAESGRIHVFI